MNDSQQSGAALTALVDAFHITDRSLLRARERVRVQATADTQAEFRRHALRYFRALEREARHHLADLDRKLDELYQRQYNLQAERGVAQRRLAGAQNVLSALGDASAGKNAQ
jgi:Lon protease-like protein